MRITRFKNDHEDEQAGHQIDKHPNRNTCAHVCMDNRTHRQNKQTRGADVQTIERTSDLTITLTNKQEQTNTQSITPANAQHTHTQHINSHKNKHTHKQTHNKPTNQKHNEQTKGRTNNSKPPALPPSPTHQTFKTHSAQPTKVIRGNQKWLANLYETAFTINGYSHHAKHRNEQSLQELVYISCPEIFTDSKSISNKTTSQPGNQPTGQPVNQQTS